MSTPIPNVLTGTATETDLAEEVDDNQIDSAQLADHEPSGRRSALADAWDEIVYGSTLVSILAVVLGLLVGAILIVLVDPTVQAAAGYFFARPGDFFAAIGNAVFGAYSALFQGGVYNVTASDFAGGIAPFLTSLGFATPLAIAGLGIALSFRSGMFNIGGQGQLLIGGAVAGFIGFAWPLPPGWHLFVAVAAGVIGGAIWAGIAGVLKATTGAHEVITTIMLNYIALYLIGYLLTTPILQAPGSNNPTSPAELPTALLPNLLGPNFALNLGFVLAVVSTIVAAWLLKRSSLGFRLRAVGENPRAARIGGISVRRTYLYAMLISGAFIGLAGAYQTLGQITTGFTPTFDAGIGFTAITVALLGRSRPWGVLGAGVLFGVFQAGGYTMQAADGIAIELVSIVQVVIVLFIAAPPLVRAIFHLPQPSRRRIRDAGRK